MKSRKTWKTLSKSRSKSKSKVRILANKLRIQDLNIRVQSGQNFNEKSEEQNKICANTKRNLRNLRANNRYEKHNSSVDFKTKIQDKRSTYSNFFSKRK